MHQRRNMFESSSPVLLEHNYLLKYFTNVHKLIAYSGITRHTMRLTLYTLSKHGKKRTLCDY